MFDGRVGTSAAMVGTMGITGVCLGVAAVGTRVFVGASGGLVATRAGADDVLVAASVGAETGGVEGAAHAVSRVNTNASDNAMAE